MEVLQFFDALSPVAEQVIDVVKITLEDITTRISVSRDPQLAEQLVEVPKILYFLKQIIDVPVPRGRGASSPRFFSQNGIFQLVVEVIKVLAQDRVQQRHRHPQFSRSSS